MILCRALLLQLLLIPSFLFSQHNSAKEIPFELLQSGHILVNASVNGIDGKFIFDTGAGITAFTKTFFQKIPGTQLQDGGYTGFRATGERIDLDLYKVSNFQMGPFRNSLHEVSYIDAELGGIDGIISLKSIAPASFTIDFEKKVLRIESNASLTAIAKKTRVIPVQLEESRGKALTVFAVFKVNDQLTLQFSLDSGAGKDVYRINSKYLKALGINTGDTMAVKKYEKKSEINPAHVSSIFVTQVKKIAPLSDSIIQATNIPVQFVEELIYDGIIWINWLGSQITFDLQHQKLYVSSRQ